MRKTKVKRTRRNTTQIIDALDRFCSLVAPEFTARLAHAEAEAYKAKYELAFLRSKLAGLLSRDQIEAARIAGCAPEIYALEWIEIQKEHLAIPAFCGTYTSLADLRNETRRIY